MPARLRPTAPFAADAVLVGDPGRALLLAQELLEQPKMSNHARGLWGYSGRTPAGHELSVQSTGMGGPSAALVHYFGLSADAAHLLLWESGSAQRAFERAFAQHDEKDRAKFLETVIARVNEDALKRKDRALERTALLWSKPPKKEPGDDDLPPPEISSDRKTAYL